MGKDYVQLSNQSAREEEGEEGEEEEADARHKMKSRQRAPELRWVRMICVKVARYDSFPEARRKTSLPISDPSVGLLALPCGKD